MHMQRMAGSSLYFVSVAVWMAVGLRLGLAVSHSVSLTSATAGPWRSTRGVHTGWRARGAPAGTPDTACSTMWSDGQYNALRSHRSRSLRASSRHRAATRWCLHYPLDPGALSRLGCHCARHLGTIACVTLSGERRNFSSPGIQDPRCHRWQVHRQSVIAVTRLFVSFAFEALGAWRVKAQKFV